MKIHVLAAALLSAVALAACGSSGDNTSTAANADDRDTARLKLDECLRKQGIELPQRGAGSGGRPTGAQITKLQKAIRGACKKEAQSAFGNVTDEQREEFRDQFAKFSSCMRKNGVDIPDFTPGQGPPAGAARINRNTPKFKKAMEACQSLRPDGAGGRAGPGPGPAPGGPS